VEDEFTDIRFGPDGVAAQSAGSGGGDVGGDPIGGGSGAGDDDRRDGRLVKACDDLAAFMETVAAIKNGCALREMYASQNGIRRKYTEVEANRVISGVDFAELYSDWE